ncbi:Cold-shock DNA-binding domain [Musa troglodytarum]|uniref:Cold-shock DNA-binding domain n=1 Tax=Musa troglodytarum TaxID=320322 RepID=A0A9E7JCE8_9LILI|nr:Cold-shock DNA-binding domain [Musa troglodytarum]
MVQASGRSRGTVKWFGFIWPDDGGEDLFVHRCPIKAQVYRTFAESDVAEGYDGPTKAVDITGPGGSDIPGGGDCRSDCYGRAAGVGEGAGACYNCVEAGHIPRDCYSGGEGGGACFNCGETGHLAWDCCQGDGGDGGYSG